MEHKSNSIDEMPERVPSLGRLFNFSTNAINRYCQDRLSEHELTLPQWVMLSALWRQDGLQITDLANYAGTNPPAASRIIDRMELNGTVRRRSDKQDGRSVRVYLTKTGGALKSLMGFYQEVNDVLLKDFTKEESKQLFDLLERALDNATHAVDAHSNRSTRNSEK